MNTQVIELVNYGIHLQTTSQVEKAEEAYKAALAIDPLNPDANHNLAIIEIAQRRYSSAEDRLRKSVAARPDITQYWVSLINCLVSSKSYISIDRLTVDLENKIKNKRIEDNLTLRFQFANAFFKVGRYNKCYEYYTFIKQMGQLSDDLRLNLIIYAYLSGEFKVAKKEISVMFDVPNKDHLSRLANVLLKIIEIDNDASTLPTVIERDLENNTWDITTKLFVAASAYMSIGKAKAPVEKWDWLVTKSFDNWYSHLGLTSRPSNRKNAPRRKMEVVTLHHYGRSGTGLLHSLIDSHPQVSTIPSVYLSEFFNLDFWNSTCKDTLVEDFIKRYDIIFDSRSTTPVPSRNRRQLHNLGRDEGMTCLGESRDDYLTVSRDKFRDKLSQLTSESTSVSPRKFLEDVHIAFEFAIRNKSKRKNILFYHIHNPDDLTMLHFLHEQRNGKAILLVREPVQSLSSWLRSSMDNIDYENVSHKIIQMLYELDHPKYLLMNTVGIKLEDLKETPRKTLGHLCDWLGINLSESLFKMTAQGKRWWGDPSSPNYYTDGMEPFGKEALKRPTDDILTKRDKKIFDVLFSPVHDLYGYKSIKGLSNYKFKSIAKQIDEPLDLEKNIARQIGSSVEILERTGPYRLLHHHLRQRLKQLQKNGTYTGMVQPLSEKISVNG